MLVSTTLVHLPLAHGRVATRDQIRDPEEFARDLARFLHALHRIGSADGPWAGDHSFNRGGPVQHWDQETVAAISTMSDVIDAALASEVGRPPRPRAGRMSLFGCTVT